MSLGFISIVIQRILWIHWILTRQLFKGCMNPVLLCLFRCIRASQIKFPYLIPLLAVFFFVTDDNDDLPKNIIMGLILTFLGCNSVVYLLSSIFIEQIKGLKLLLNAGKSQIIKNVSRTLVPVSLHHTLHIRVLKRRAKSREPLKPQWKIIYGWYRGLERV